MMTLKESQVINADAKTKPGEKIFINFSYGLKNKEDFSALIKENEYYIFTAFVIKDQRPLCVFGSTRRHRELEEAIINDIGTLDNVVYGQLWLKDLRAKSLIFNFPLGNNDDENEKRLLFCLGSISEELLEKSMIVKDNKNKFSYSKENKLLVKDLSFR